MQGVLHLEIEHIVVIKHCNSRSCLWDNDYCMVGVRAKIDSKGSYIKCEASPMLHTANHESFLTLKVLHINGMSIIAFTLVSSFVPRLPEHLIDHEPANEAN